MDSLYISIFPGINKRIRNNPSIHVHDFRNDLPLFQQSIQGFWAAACFKIAGLLQSGFTKQAIYGRQYNHQRLLRTTISLDRRIFNTYSMVRTYRFWIWICNWESRDCNGYRMSSCCYWSWGYCTCKKQSTCCSIHSKAFKIQRILMPRKSMIFDGFQNQHTEKWWKTWHGKLGITSLHS